MKKITPLFCLLLICAMMLSWVQPAVAADEYGTGFDLLYYDNSIAVDYWKAFDLYSCAQENRNNLGSFMPMFCTDSLTSSSRSFSGLGLSINTTFNKPVLCFYWGRDKLTPYTSYDLPVGSFVTLSSYTHSDFARPYSGWGSSYAAQKFWFFLSYEDALDAYLTTGFSYTLYFLREDTRIFPAATNAKCMVVGFENLGVFKPDGVVSTYSNASDKVCTVNSVYYSSYWLCPLNYKTISGVWQAKDTISGSSSVSQDLNFTVKFSGADVSYTGIDFQIAGSTNAVSYSLASGSETVYVNEWLGATRKTIDLGSEPQNVSSEFYSWFTSNYTRTGDSEIYDDETSKVKIYDYGSGSLIESLSLPIPHIIYATTTGIQIESYSTAETLYTYTWPGSDAFAGFSLLSRDYVDYEVGTNFVNMSDSVTLYLYGEDDLSGDSGGDDSGDPDVTDPTDPDDSPSTEPTEDPLDKEKDEADKQGNDSIDQILDVIPNVTDDIVAAYDGLIRALKYEGTAAKMMTPAIVMPELPGSVPEFVILEPQEIDFEYWFNQVPSNLMKVVRALFTGALILYCCYEVYGLIEYFVSLRSRSKK